MFPKTIDEQLAGLENLIAGRRGLQLGSFLLFADCYLILKFRVNLLMLDAEWARGHIGIGGAATIVFFFFLFSSALMPWVHILFVLPSVLGSEIMIHRLSKSGGEFLEGIKKDTLLEFAIIEDNGIAYQEYLRKEKASDEYMKDMRWGFVFLCFLGLDAFAAKGDSNSLVEMFWSALQRLPLWIFYPSATALAWVLFSLLVSSLVTFRFMGKYFLVGPRLYDFIKTSMAPDEGETSEEA